MSDDRKNAAAFDTYAVDFDETVGSSVIVQGLRRRIYQLIRERVPAGGRILDINCGTGTDCLNLSYEGYQTFGVDLSPAMIQRAQAKTPPDSTARFEVASFDRMIYLERDSFDLVLSNNSGLNCAPDLRDILTIVHDRLRPGGYFLAVMMPPFALWEFFAGLVRLDLRYMVRRGRQGTANIGGQLIDVTYYGEGDVLREARGLFTVELVCGLNIVSPSPNSLGFVQRHPVLSTRLSKVDHQISGVPLIRRWGDQILVLLRKSPA